MSEQIPRHCWMSDAKGQPTGTVCGAVVVDMSTQRGDGPFCEKCEAAVAERNARRSRQSVISALTGGGAEVARSAFAVGRATGGCWKHRTTTTCTSGR